MITVTKKIQFSSAHFYYLPSKSPEENWALFNACSNLHGHGHNYLLEVAVSGNIHPETGMVVNLKDLKTILHEEVIAPLDHQHLNHQVDFFKTRIPTLENIALYIWNRLMPRLNSQNLELKWIKLHENDDLFVEYFGEMPCSLGQA
ncbi:MAG: 6-carboxytetrahydropterin synthase [Cyanobacteria bacterium]|nr:6-carboxytetrahydropterin synthase [Cyanobacteriota bacterium]